MQISINFTSFVGLHVQFSEIPDFSIKIGEFWTTIAKNQRTFENKNAKMFDEMQLNFRIRSGAKACQSCRSRQELSNEYSLAKFGFDTAENEPLKVCQTLAKRCQKLE